jgi:2-methylcitrate dehydratase PrpD
MNSPTTQERHPTRQVAEFIVATSYADLPAHTVAAAIRPLIDTVGVLYAGTVSDVGQTIASFASRVPAAGEYGVRPIGLDVAVAPEVAAMVNGVRGHALDFDDEVSGIGHPSVPVLAALLAVPTDQPLSGQQLIEAYIVGHETLIRLGEAIGREHIKRGWHATATIGTFGAVAAAAKLLGFDVEQASTAIGLAASMSAGLTRNFGTMTKPLHAGLAARAGVLAAQLVQLGFTAAPNALDGTKGYLDVYGVGAANPAALDTLGSPYAINDPGSALKKFPACYSTHRGIDAALQLRSIRPVSHDEIDEIVCSVPPGALRSLIYSSPVTGLQGKFSMEYTVAAALIDGQITLDSFTDDQVQRPAIRSLMDRIKVAEDPRCRPEDSASRRISAGTGGFVELVMRVGGAEETVTVADTPGSPARPMSWAEIEAKFAGCLRVGGYDPAGGAEVFRQLRTLESVADVHALLAGLTEGA